MTTRFRMLFLVLLLVQISSAANILILCMPVLSHIKRPANVGRVLQEQGHNVMIAIPPQMREKVASTELGIMLYHGLGDIDLNKEIAKTTMEILFEKKTNGPRLSEIILTASLKTLGDKQFLENIRNFAPDLMILDPTTTPGRLLTLVAYKFDIPFIFIGSCRTPQYGHVPILPSVVPNLWLDYTDKMTFLERLHNTYLETLLYFRPPLIPRTVMKDYVPEKPDIHMQDLQAKALLWIITEDGILGYNAPTMPNVKLVSNLLNLRLQPLADEFQTFMDNAENGVVIVSFGSIVKTLPDQLLDKLLAAFRKTKFNFVMQHSAKNSNRFLFSKWIPQFELLSHKNTRLFITHCGANSQEEAIYAGVPMIGLPMFADQPRNAARVVRKGFGLRLDLKTFTVDELVLAIEEVITNPEYTKRTKKASAIVRSARVPPVKEAAYWINHVLTFGGDHLRSLGQDIPLWKYMGLDILAFCFLVWHIFLFIFVKTIYFLFYCCCMRQDKEKKE